MVKAAGGMSHDFPVGSGVRQGAVLSPLLFGIVMDWILTPLGSGAYPGVSLWQGRGLADVDFADDVLLLDSEAPRMQSMINEVSDRGAAFGLRLNSAKCVGMAAGFDDAPVLLVNGERLRMEESLVYLGSEVDFRGSGTKEISRRISLATASFSSLYHRLWKRHVTLRTKLRVFGSLVRPVLLYGCESWPLLNSDLRKLGVFERRCLRTILRVSPRDRLTNEELYRRTNILPLERILCERRWRWLGHILRMGNHRLPKATLLAAVHPTGKGNKSRPGASGCMTWRRTVEKEASSFEPLRRKVGGWATWRQGRWLECLEKEAQERPQWKKLTREVTGAALRSRQG